MRSDRAKVAALTAARIEGNAEVAAVTLLSLDLSSGETPSDKLKNARETLAAFDYVQDDG